MQSCLPGSCACALSQHYPAPSSIKRAPPCPMLLQTPAWALRQRRASLHCPASPRSASAACPPQMTAAAPWPGEHASGVAAWGGPAGVLLIEFCWQCCGLWFLCICGLPEVPVFFVALLRLRLGRLLSNSTHASARALLAPLHVPAGCQGCAGWSCGALRWGMPACGSWSTSPRSLRWTSR